MSGNRGSEGASGAVGASPPRPLRLAEARWPELATGDGIPLVIVPLGSTEQHGPHLPFSTDTIVAEAVAGAVAAERGAVLAPAIAYGSSGEHAGFPGTTSIGRNALALLLLELQRSLAEWAGCTVIVSAHGGNAPVLAEVVPQLRAEGHAIVWLPCVAPGADAHAGRTETSLLLHLRPELVRLDAAEAGATAPIVELMPALRSGGVKAVAPNGVLGDPRGADAAEGAALFAALVDDARARLDADHVDEAGMLRRVAPSARPVS